MLALLHDDKLVVEAHCFKSDRLQTHDVLGVLRLVQT
jgi:hypothetical protein